MAPIAILQSPLGVFFVVLRDFMLWLLCLLMVLMSCRQLLLRPLLPRGLAALVLLIVLFLRIVGPVPSGHSAGVNEATTAPAPENAMCLHKTRRPREI